MNFFTERTKKIVIVATLVIISLCSIFIVSRIATKPENYKTTIQSIDDKKATVMSVTAGAAATSTLLAAIPGDATTPISNQIMQISSYLMIVVCVLVLEKSLLMVMGYLSFNILIPVACGLLGVYTFCKKKILKNLALKFIAFAMVIISIIPFSLKIGDMIYNANSLAIEQAIKDADEISAESDVKDNSWLDNIKNGISSAGDYAKQKLNQFIDVIAIFIIAYCAIPIIVVMLLVWFIKFLFGIEIPLKSASLSINDHLKKSFSTDKKLDMSE